MTEGGPVDYVCVGREHLAIGRTRPDGSGHLTLHEGKWAYCSAGRPLEQHEWAATGGLPVVSLRHRLLAREVDALPRRS